MKILQLETLMVGTKDFKCNFEYSRKLPKDKGKGHDFFFIIVFFNHHCFKAITAPSWVSNLKFQTLWSSNREQGILLNENISNRYLKYT